MLSGGPPSTPRPHVTGKQQPPIPHGAWTPGNQVFIGPPTTIERHVHTLNVRHHAATAIQHVWRHHRRRHAALKIQQWFRRLQRCRLVVLAVCMRRLWRSGEAAPALIGFPSLSVLKQCANKRLQIVIKAQAVFRGALARRRYSLTMDRIRQCQAVVRAWIARRRYLQLRTAVIMIQRRFRIQRKSNLKSNLPKSPMLQAAGTPSRIPVPVRMLRLRADETSIADGQDDITQKRQMLMAIRAKRKLLKTLVGQSVDTTESAVDQQQPPPTELASINTTSSQPIATQPSDTRNLVSNVILPNISHLITSEVDRLTIMNTKMNSGYTRPIDINVIQKPGPRPPSPDAAALKRLAQQRRLENEEYVPTDKIKWHPELERFSPVGLDPDQRDFKRLKSCLKISMNCDTVETIGGDSLAVSPVRVQRIEWVNPPPKRRSFKSNNIRGRRK